MAARRIYVSCLPGLEQLLQKEISRNVFASGRVPGLVKSRGGIEFDSLKPAGEIGNATGIASHVSTRLVSFKCRALGELERKVRQFAQQGEFGKNLQIGKITASATKSRVYHKGAIVERVSRALEEVGMSVKNGEGKLLIRFENDECTISFESGKPAHQRGYRLYSGKAPLREDLARAIVYASDWNPNTELFLDPFCGSGTIAIEAGLMAASLDVKSSPQINASDRDTGVISGASENANRANVNISFSCQSFSNSMEASAKQSAKGLILCNPPYGQRTANVDFKIERLFRSLFASFHSTKMPSGWRLMLLCPAPLIRFAGGRSKEILRTTNGGIKVSLFEIQS